jgi:hypothetical protein
MHLVSNIENINEPNKIPPLQHRLFYLNFRYLVNTFQRNGHPLRDKLEKLNDLSPQKCRIPFHEVSGLNIQLEFGYMRLQSTPTDIWRYAGAGWQYNEVGKIPRGPSRLGAPKAIGGPSAS